jgi:hypothetical protein
MNLNGAHFWMRAACFIFGLFQSITIEAWPLYGRKITTPPP